MPKPKFGTGKSSVKNSGRKYLHLRSEYIDNSLKFLNWVNGLGFERTLLGRIAQKLDKNYRVRHVSLLFLFALGLSFLLFFDFDFSYSVRVGEVVAHDIKSPLSFSVRDEISTEQKSDEAAAAIPLVYEYDRNVFEETSSQVAIAFRKMREELRHVTWARDEFERDEQTRDLFRLKPQFEALLTRTVSDRVFEWLIMQRFSQPVLNAAWDALGEWSGYKIIDGYDKSVVPGTREIQVRDVARGGRALLIRMGEVRDLSREEDFSVENLGSWKHFSANDRHLLYLFVRSLMVPNITVNKQETNLRRKKARENVLPVMITVTKNQIIVPEGAVVQPIHASLIREIERQRSVRSRNLVALISALMFVALILVCFSYLRRFTLNRVRVDAKDIAIMGVVTLIVVSIAKIFIFLTNSAISGKYGSAVPEDAFLYAAPVASGSMLVGLLLVSGEVVWIFSLFIAVVLGLMVEMKFAYFVVTIVGSIAASRGVYSCKQRNDIYWAGLRTGLVNALMITLMVTIDRYGHEGYTHYLAWMVPAGLVSGVLSSMVAMTLIPLLESVFNCTTDVKLLELSNLNHALLKEMIVKAPGTYHHSLVVGSMVEAAAEAIGANSLLAKVMSYYHDIGKTEHAAYFIENQKPGNNPHDHLSPHMSKTILIAHVKDGVELGLKHKLGKPIIDGIVQHHGTTLIAFFYNRAVEGQNAHIDSVHEADFRYPGPRPLFREAALIMLADSIEAASRSLDEPTPVRLQNIVKNIVQRKFMDGQLDECNLTFKELSLIEDSFNKILLGIYHQRIDYPRRAGGGAALPPTAAVKITSKKGSATA